MAQPLSFRWDEEFVARIDSARGDVSRSLWVRRAVEQALGGQQKRGNAREAEERDVVNREPSKPAERPYRQHVPGPNVENIRSSSQSKRDVKPYPKKGKR